MVRWLQGDSEADEVYVEHEYDNIKHLHAACLV